MSWKLTLEATSGPDEGVRFAYHVADAIVFGRNGTPDLAGRWPTDERISRKHLVVESAETGVSVRPATSGRRFFVDDSPREDGMLSGGERLKLGASVFVARLERAVAPPPAPPPDRPLRKPPATTHVRICRLDDLELREEIGRGAMGRVFAARDASGRRLCVKLVRTDVEDLDEALRRFFAREIDLLGGLDHPNIVKMLYAGRGEKDLFLAMEWIEGTSLDAEVGTSGPLSLLDVCAVGRQMLGALALAHEQGIVHRDVKPDNVMLRRGQGGIHAILIDFGLARVAGASGDRGLTATGEGRGSYGFSALEALKDAKRAGPSADLFSVGATLRFALTGRNYFDFESTASRARLLQVIGGQETTPLREERPDVPAALARVIERAMAVDPAARWASAAEMLERLVFAEGEVHRRLAGDPPS